MKTRSSLFK